MSNRKLRTKLQQALIAYEDDHNLKGYEVAKQIGISASFYSQLKSGERSAAKYETLKLIADNLELPIDRLCDTGEGQISSSKEGEEIALRELILHYKSLANEYKEICAELKLKNSFLENELLKTKEELQKKKSVSVVKISNSP